MKGFVEEITWTVIIWIFFVILIIIAFLHFIMVSIFDPWTPGTIVYSIEIADISNKPYFLAEVLTHHKIEDRKLIEHCTRSVIVNSLEWRSGTNIEDPLKEFLGKYGEYKVVLHGRDELLSIGERESKFTDASIPLLYKGLAGYLTVSVK